MSAVPEPDPDAPLRPILLDGRAPGPGEPAVRLPLPHPLPLCDRDLRGVRAAARRPRRRPVLGLPPCRDDRAQGRGRPRERRAGAVGGLVTAPRRIGGLSEVIGALPRASFVDAYGTLHDGRVTLPFVAEALVRARAAGRTVVIVTNSPQRVGGMVAADGERRLSA